MKVDDPQHRLAAALGRVPSGLYVLTLVRDKIETGMLASWVMQCSFSPPQLSVAVRREREVASLLTQGSLFTLNILEGSQTDMIVHFGKGFALGADAFDKVDVTRQPPRGAVLNEALARLECEVIDRFAAGDHDLIIGRIVEGALLDEGQPMVHIRKNGLHY
jgi:flavin reductase (DIM6/NTAB) family NADH-FMN oxidoreductase RutF